jgi:hypothetical protein
VNVLISRRIAGFAALTIALAGGSAGFNTASAQGISYTVAPAAASLQWDKDLGLKNHSLYGAQASIDFERIVSLQGYYFTNDKVNSAVDRLGLSGSLAQQLKDQRLGVRSMGANIVWKFWPGGIAPFIKTGGGIVELRPDSGRVSKQIALNVGGGIRIGANAPVFLDLFAEDMMLRVDRYALFDRGSSSVPVDPRARDLRHNLLVGAALGIPLGLNRDDRERNAAQHVQWGLSGASLSLEPFAGRLTFDNKSRGSTVNSPALRDQDLAGVRAGIDLGRYVGVRGFYWRGTDKNFKRLESLQSYGGELQFRLNSSPGLTPFLLAGAGELDFKQNDTTATAQRSEDKLSLLLGGGVSLPFGERVALNFTARDYLYGQGNGADSVSSPSDLRNNWMFSVGLRVSLAGHSGSDAAVRSAARQKQLEARLRSDSVRFADSRTTGMGRESMVTVNGRRVRRDSMNLALIRIDTTYLDSTRADSAMRVRRTGSGAAVITIPVPAVGEVYVRYGPPPAGSGSLPKMPADAASDSARVSSMSAADREAYMNRRIDSLVTVRVNERTANLRPPTPQTVIIQQPAATPPSVVMTPAAQPAAVVEQPRKYNVVGSETRGGLVVYSGFTVNDGAQFVVGGRFDLGPLGRADSPIHFAPEVAFGGGSGGRSTMLVGNAQYLFRKMRLTNDRTIQPHVYAGVGILNFSNRVGSRDGLQGVINLGYGVSIPLTKNAGNRAAPVLTLEHQGIDFFQLNRLLVGLSWRL